MKKLAAIGFALAIFGFAGAAKADDDYRCSGNGKLSLQEAVGKAEALGYAVKETERSKGCWKVEGFDRNGAEIEIRFDPVSGDIVKPRDWRPPSGG